MRNGEGWRLNREGWVPCVMKRPELRGQRRPRTSGGAPVGLAVENGRPAGGRD
jgi:hypothetical protein